MKYRYCASVLYFTLSFTLFSLTQTSLLLTFSGQADFFLGLTYVSYYFLSLGTFQTIKLIRPQAEGTTSITGART